MASLRQSQMTSSMVSALSPQIHQTDPNHRKPLWPYSPTLFEILLTSDSFWVILGWDSVFQLILEVVFLIVFSKSRGLIFYLCIKNLFWFSLFYSLGSENCAIKEESTLIDLTQTQGSFSLKGQLYVESFNFNE